MTPKPKLSRGHSITFKVVATGRTRQAAVAEILAALDDADVPPDAQWCMELHKGREVPGNGAPYMEADTIHVSATWAEDLD